MIIRPNFLAILLMVTASLVAQTNTFPLSGNVGIGTTSPGTNLLHVRYGTSGGSAYNVGGLVVESGGRSSIQLLSPNSGDAYLFFGDATTANKGYVGQTGSAASPASRMYYYSVGGHTFNGGNVGIGTDTPYSGTGVTSLTISATSYPLVALQYGSNNIGQLIGYSDHVAINTTGARHLTLETNDTERVRITSAGNVGIGVSSPLDKLQVDEGPIADSYSIVSDTIYNAFNIRSSRSTNDYGGMNAKYASINIATLGVTTTGESNDHRVGDLRFALKSSGTATTMTDVMTLRYNGNVGVGTTTPSHKLAVNGTIRAKEVIVDTSWSDYVFEDSYRLKTLSETEAYIKAERRLPGVPSAREVAEHGISVGDMQARLLAKVEELTLHAIRQEKRFQDLENENTTLRTEVNALKRRLSP
jgi:hypothetical protein